ncbi:hypothetical protein [Natrinema sp. 1APR25-10V2]|uniref:hypothetical protein n=1 Tax=Natrinema sp. 1APR25-10V2 TaxID=2951081 RepID=UPI00287401B9|nr:hypothetical protein [Natrinema sp. 1APR25-10V2]MDS0477068.1 hypothetical protein [Natrinema sp. 1APR25-10V2]
MWNEESGVAIVRDASGTIVLEQPIAAEQKPEPPENPPDDNVSDGSTTPSDGDGTTEPTNPSNDDEPTQPADPPSGDGPADSGTPPADNATEGFH